MENPPPYGSEPPLMPVDGPPQAVPGAGRPTAPAAEPATPRKAHAAAGARTMVLAAALAGVGGLVGGMIFTSPKGSAASNGATPAARDGATTANGAATNPTAPSFGDGGRGYRDDDGDGSRWTSPGRSDQSAIPPSGDVGPQFGGPGGMTTSRGS